MLFFPFSFLLFKTEKKKNAKQLDNYPTASLP